MDNFEAEKDLRRALKYEEKKAKQREKRRLGPNGGTGAKGYGLFKKDRLFPQADKPASSTQLPKEPKAKRIKRVNVKSPESQTGGYTGNSCNQKQDPGTKKGRRVFDVIEKLRAYHSNDDLRKTNKHSVPTSGTTKQRKRTEIYERAELLSNHHFKGQIIVLIHFPNTKQSTTYGKAFGNVAQSFLDTHKTFEKFFFEACNAADRGVDVISQNPDSTNIQAVPEDNQNPNSVFEMNFVNGGSEEELTTLNLVLQQCGNLEPLNIVSSNCAPPFADPPQIVSFTPPPDSAGESITSLSPLFGESIATLQITSSLKASMLPAEENKTPAAPTRPIVSCPTPPTIPASATMPIVVPDAPARPVLSCPTPPTIPASAALRIMAPTAPAWPVLSCHTPPSIPASTVPPSMVTGPLTDLDKVSIPKSKDLPHKSSSVAQVIPCSQKTYGSRVGKKKPFAPSPTPASIAPPKIIPAVPVRLALSCDTSPLIPVFTTLPILVASPLPDLDAIPKPKELPQILSLVTEVTPCTKKTYGSRVSKKKPVAPSPIPASIETPKMISVVPARPVLSCATSPPLPAFTGQPISVPSPLPDLDAMSIPKPKELPKILSSVTEVIPCAQKTCLSRVGQKKTVAPSPIQASTALPKTIPAGPACPIVSCATTSPIPTSAAPPIMVLSPPPDLDFVAPAVAPPAPSLSVVALTSYQEKRRKSFENEPSVSAAKKNRMVSENFSARIPTMRRTARISKTNSKYDTDA